MNVRQQKYKLNRLSGMNQYNAARAAGYSHNTAWKDGKRIENLAKIGIADAFEQAGLTDKALVAHAREGLNAVKEVVFEGVKTGLEQPDWTVRHKYFETILKLTDRLKDKVEHSGKIGGGTTVNVYPNKTIVFQDINDNSNEADSNRLHEPESSEGTRLEGKI